jgi:alkylation response protein AidB-like acyl-CoA dehydrogenase
MAGIQADSTGPMYRKLPHGRFVRPESGHSDDPAYPVQRACAAKYWVSDLLSKVVDECVQLHGGYGFMLEYPIARAYIDTRANRIYGGTNEIMKELISRAI